MTSGFILLRPFQYVSHRIRSLAANCLLPLLVRSGEALLKAKVCETFLQPWEELSRSKPGSKEYEFPLVLVYMYNVMISSQNTMHCQAVTAVSRASCCHVYQ